MERVNYVTAGFFSESVLKLKNPTRPDGIDKDKINFRSRKGTDRYSVFKTSGLTQTGARKQFGFERMNARFEQVEKCIEAAQLFVRPMTNYLCYKTRLLWDLNLNVLALNLKRNRTRILNQRESVSVTSSYLPFKF